MLSDGCHKVEDLPSQLPPALIDATLQLWQEGSQQHWLSTAGSSMKPLIHDRDRVLVSHDLQRLRRGDIVVFRRAGRIIAHRIIRITRQANEQILTTKGDNVLRFDEPIEVQNAIGKVVALQRNGSHLQLDTPRWQIISWIIATVTIVAATPYGWVRIVKRRMLGLRSMLLAAAIRRFAAAMLVRMIGTVHAILSKRS